MTEQVAKIILQTRRDHSFGLLSRQRHITNAARHLLFEMRLPITITLLFASSTFGFCQSKADKQLIVNVISKHFNWYISSLDSNHQHAYVRVKINDDGTTFLDVRDYLEYLRKLGTGSTKFIESEERRTSGCNYLLKHLKKDEEFEMDIHKQCDFVYFYFWLYSNKAVDGVVNTSVTKRRRTAMAETMLLIDGREFKSLGIELVKLDGKWLINSISKK